MKMAIKGGIKAPRTTKASRTPGKDKGGTCVTDVEKKFYLTHPHAHRLNPHKYSVWHQIARSNHGIKG
jgi:hypothetical protein